MLVEPLPVLLLEVCAGFFFCFLHTFRRWGAGATMPRTISWCLLLSDLAWVSWMLQPSVLSTASDATAKKVVRIVHKGG